MECLSCRRKSTTFDTFLDLSLSLRLGREDFALEDVTLDDCLKDFVKAEKMEQSGYRCEGCKRESTMRKSLSLYKLPQVLVLHLKRFASHSVRREKLKTRVKIEDVIDVRDCAPLLPPNTLAMTRTRYKLFGIVHHYGSLSGGHYISEILSLEDNKWYECDDTSVQQLRTPVSRHSSSAYVLFY
mmetsp:Transcript_47282/g.34569  ORF Transcript_47282/g.34569 Transcript_47282/m.34569 type:complete len:184 (+) Transcript_47282:823-1374(+)|eukprot:CAMPEP_0202964792 /NCGR_PEP_ID=MMETSP1396-20130829/8890_1 /ASSEMBLY_ACC=CAM_ASM_000872 /TAXON_ID= /ORGANISM="Pseudokeronopsis sp., Strain Brazil" /LENGTH=183 /DNA_ID=CAMNT_0049687169 /DNA_START=1029 /DNA_END=1580 /DNA_ORIENTATION=-